MTEYILITALEPPYEDPLKHEFIGYLNSLEDRGIIDKYLMFDINATDSSCVKRTEDEFKKLYDEDLPVKVKENLGSKVLKFDRTAESERLVKEEGLSGQRLEDNLDLLEYEDKGYGLFIGVAKLIDKKQFLDIKQKIVNRYERYGMSIDFFISAL